MAALVPVLEYSAHFHGTGKNEFLNFLFHFLLHIFQDDKIYQNMINNNTY